MNKFIVDGKIIDTPEVKKINRGSVTNFKLLNIDGAGDKAIESTFYCEAWGDVGALIKNFRKGDTITIEGKMLENTWVDKETGKNRSLLRLRVVGCSSYIGYNTISPEVTEQPAQVAHTIATEPASNHSVELPF